MHTRTRLLMAAITAMVALMLAASTAAALRSLSVEGETTVAGGGVLTFLNTERGREVICPATITRTISRAIPKIEGVLLGKITRIVTNRPETRCRANGATLESIIILLFEGEREEALRGRLYFLSIVGTLPNITGIRKVIRRLRVGFRANILGISVTCLYEEGERELEGVHATENLNERQQLVEVTIGENIDLRTSESSSFCPREGRLSGVARTEGTPPVIRLV